MIRNNDRCSLTPTNPTSRFLPFSASLLLCVFALNNAPVLRITDFMHLSPLWGLMRHRTEIQAAVVKKKPVDLSIHSEQ